MYSRVHNNSGCVGDGEVRLTYRMQALRAKQGYHLAPESSSWSFAGGDRRRRA